jgi:hypothetical protein
MAEMKVIYLTYMYFDEYRSDPRDFFYVVIDEPYHYGYYRINTDGEKLLQKYLKSDFDGYYDFVWFRRKYFGPMALYDPPVPIKELTFVEIHNVWLCAEKRLR